MNKVHLIVGPPGAGKSTYATEQAAKTGGTVIDYDNFRALAPDADTAERWRLEAESRAHDLGKDVFVVRTLAKADERAEAAERIKADETIVLLTSAEVSKARVSERDGDDSKHEAIDAWWQDYTGIEGETTITFDDEPEEPADPAEPEPSDPETAEQGDAEDSEDSDAEGEPTSDEDPAPGQDVQALIEAARAEERAKANEEFALERFNTHLSAEATARKLNTDALHLLKTSLAPTAFLKPDNSVNTEALTTFLDAFTRAKGSHENHSGHRGTQAVGGKELGKAKAEEFLNKKGR
ncbi:ATP-binding protein [Rothia nasimurium]|uniref:ATP-binding protein n=1 Tax=Rothia nasimurium TaxID=85336 RepID=UPI001F181CAA|nr:ATP-binding protein [Rothia nasimurium]